MSATVIRGGSIVTMDPAIPDLVGDILVEDDRIVAVAPRIDADADVVDASGHIVIPGFVDTHRHTWQSSIRHTHADRDPLTYFVDVLQGVGPRFRPEDVRIGNLLGAAFSISAGTTTLVDWSQIQNSPEHTDAAIAGLRESGIRGVFAYGWPMDGTRDWLGNSALRHPADIRRVRSEHFASDDDLLHLAMAARGPEETMPDVWKDDLRLARELGIRTSVHTGAYPPNRSAHAIRQYEAAGLLGDDMTIIHCNHLDDEELRMMADRGASAALGPHCEMNSSGVGDIPLDRLLAAGLRPSLSGDTETKATGDMFTQMRVLFAHYRQWVGGGHSSVAEPYPLTLRDVLEFATIRGAHAVGLADQIGSLSIGKKADLLVIRATDLNLAPVGDPVAALVLAAHEGNVDSVMIDGGWVKRHGRLTNLDSRIIVEQAQMSRNRLHSN